MNMTQKLKLAKEKQQKKSDIKKSEKDTLKDKISEIKKSCKDVMQEMNLYMAFFETCSLIQKQLLFEIFSEIDNDIQQRIYEYHLQ